MISKEAVKYSLNNLRQRKTRSIFTIISIFIGIATIFIFVSFGLGLYNYIEEITTSSSADKVIIQPKGGMGIPGTDDTFAFKEDELKAIEQTSGVYEASGSIFKSTEVIQGKKRIYTFLVSYDPKKPLIMEVSNIDILSGRGLKSGDSGVVLGYAFMKENLVFPKAYSIGDLIEIQRKKLKVLGFFEEVGTINDDSQIYVTNDFLKDLYEKEFNYTWIVAKVDRSNIEQVVRNIEKALSFLEDFFNFKANLNIIEQDTIVRYKGKEVHFKLKKVMPFLNKIQLEIIEVVKSDGEHLYLDFLKSGKEGLHHLGIYVKNADELIKYYKNKYNL
ncbi:MAG: ABC transporter permease, partial [Nanoarchaeota archaeon]